MDIGYGKWLAEINDLSLLLLGSFLAEKPGSEKEIEVSKRELE